MPEENVKTTYRYCLHCMRVVTQASGACPHCGYDINGRVRPGTVPPGSLIHYGQYLVGDVIGQGGFGITYIGEDMGLRIPVAIKEYYPNGSVTRDHRTSSVYSIAVDEKDTSFASGRDKFIQEAQILARFSGTPGIVDVKSVFQENNTAYIVMQYISGKTLNEYVNANGLVSQDRLLKMMQPVMNALKEIHSKNLIHRDISPDNLKFNGNTLTLIDFGSARIESSEANKSLSVVVKHGFAPIEQYQSHGTQGPWTDIYALCATMYWCLTGKLPPAAPDRVIEDNLKKPSDLSISLTQPFERALLKGLSFRPKDRYQSIEEMASDMYGIDEKAEAERIAREKKAEEERKLSAQRAEQLRIEKEKKAAALKAEQERKAAKLRSAVEKKAQRAQNKQTEAPEEIKKKKNRLAVMAAVLVVAIAAGIILAKVIIPKQRTEKAYQNAITLMKESSVGNTVCFGSYEQDNDFSNGKEDIEWIILDRDDNSLLLISKYALDCRQYNNSYNSYTDQTWETSNLRTWLNGTFPINAFSSDERAMIVTTKVSADKNPEYSTDPGNATNDKVFLLSVSEAEKYFSTNSSRRCSPTAYAIAQGARRAYNYYMTTEGENTCSWWLRSPGFNEFSAAYVGVGGSIICSGVVVSSDNNAVRPAMWVDLSKIS